MTLEDRQSPIDITSTNDDKSRSSQSPSEPSENGQSSHDTSIVTNLTVPMEGSEVAKKPMSIEREDGDPSETKELNIQTNTVAPGKPIKLPTRMPISNGEPPMHSDHCNPSVSITDGKSATDMSTTGLQPQETNSGKAQNSEANDDDDDRHTQANKSIEEIDCEKTVELSTDSRAKDAAGKLPDYIQYVQLMEERVTLLESKMQKATGFEDKLKEAKTPSERLPVIPELRQVTWNEFKHRTKGDKMIYAIEALAGEAKYYYQRAQERTLVPKPSTSRGSLEQRDPVFRIRINSTPVLSILADITDTDWSMKPTVLLYPFKLLARHDISIRETLKRLENTWGSRESETASKENMNNLSANDQETINKSTSKPQASRTFSDKIEAEVTPGGNSATEVIKANCKEVVSGDVPNIDGAPSDHAQEKVKSVDVADSPEALKDLRCLVQFMDEELAPVIEKVNNAS